MFTENKKQIFDAIAASDRIAIFRHIRMDGDCVGASKGLQRILQLTWPEKDIRLVDEQTSDFLAFLGADTDTADDDFYRSALAIVVDTATADRVSNQKFRLCKQIIKIDHHIPVDSYGHIEWVEEHKSSACELITEFYETFRDTLRIDPQAALYLYTGMVTDTGRFRFEGVNGDTLRRAGTLLDVGINTEWLFAQLYLDDYAYMKFKAEVYEKMSITENGVAYVFIDREMQERFGLNHEQASASVSCMDSIRGCLAWLAFIENKDGAIRVRLRSRFAPISPVAEKWRGGGHANASGGTVYNQEELQALVRDADAHIKQYKETHEGWL